MFKDSILFPALLIALVALFAVSMFFLTFVRVAAPVVTR